MTLVRHALRRAAAAAAAKAAGGASSVHTHSTSRTLTAVLAASPSSSQQHASLITSPSPSFSRNSVGGTGFSPLEEDYAAQKALDAQAVGTTLVVQAQRNHLVWDTLGGLRRFQ